MPGAGGGMRRPEDIGLDGEGTRCGRGNMAVKILEPG